MKIGKEVKDKKTLIYKLDLATFYTDEKSSMPPFKNGQQLPISVVRRSIGHPLTKVFKTDEKASYILRRVVDPNEETRKQAIWEHTDKVIKVFPELEKEIKEASEKIAQPGCTSCGKNTAKRTILLKMAELYKKEERDVSSLKNIFNIMDLATLQGKTVMGSKIVNSNITMGPRPACSDCARKHIAQAIVLLAETHLGYPEHRWLAIGHLAEASDETVADHQEIAEDIRTERLRLMANSGYKPNLMELIERISDIEDSKNTK